MTDDREKRGEAAEEPARPTVREKTLKHFKGLLAAAAGATLAASSCCSGAQDDPVVCDPLPPPVDAGVESDEGDQVDQGQGQGGEGGVTITDGGPTPYPPIPDEPPVVCDPLPPPMQDE